MKKWNAREIEAWVKAPREPVGRREDMVEMIHLFHPKVAFLRTLPPNATLLDVGAGDGSLPTLFRWPNPGRTDVRAYAYSLEKGAHFDQYDGYELCNFDEAPPRFEGLSFDAVFCSHFIEHIARPEAFVDWLAERVKPGANVYLEWPSDTSDTAPTKTELAELGMPFTIGNFHDDRTHKRIPSRDAIAEDFRRHGFEEVARGRVCMPFFEDEALAHDGQTLLEEGVCTYEVQLAYWSKVGWAQYLVMRMP